MSQLSRTKRRLHVLRQKQYQLPLKENKRVAGEIKRLTKKCEDLRADIQLNRTFAQLDKDNQADEWIYRDELADKPPLADRYHQLILVTWHRIADTCMPIRRRLDREADYMYDHGSTKLGDSTVHEINNFRHYSTAVVHGIKATHVALQRNDYYDAYRYYWRTKHLVSLAAPNSKNRQQNNY